jgi:hypothetical protein
VAPNRRGNFLCHNGPIPQDVKAVLEPTASTGIRSNQ